VMLRGGTVAMGRLLAVGTSSHHMPTTNAELH
jgi:hypothetical protein